MDQPRAKLLAMRREMFRMANHEALALLARSPVVHLASVDEAGAPVLRTVHGVLVDGALAFHGAPAGEKMQAMGRPVVVSAEEVVAVVPSYFFDPEMACPATTYYRSVQVHGRLERVDDVETKARVLAELMRKYQPEGGHVPITAEDPRYRKQIEGILIVRVALATIDGKAKLAQNRKPDELARLLAQLWRRGLPGDPAAIEALRAANPATPTPAFLQAPPGARLCCALEATQVEGALALLVGQYWTVEVPRAALARAQLGSVAWVGAHDESGRLIATARAVGDGERFAGLYDVAVAPDWRGRGLGRAVVRLLLDHPRVRDARRIYLRTRDAHSFYAQFGFAPVASATAPSNDMERLRADGERSASAGGP